MKRIIALSLALLCLAVPQATRAEGSELPPLTGDNVNQQNYSAWNNCVDSYLTKTDTGYMAFLNNGSGMYALYYDNAYVLEKTVKVGEELPLFGGFHATKDCYFLVTGQENRDQKADVECYRITKYDKNWKRIKSVGLYDCNTYIPFDAGSCRMADAGKYLVIRTCHEMYDSGDGLHHQANVTMQVDMEEMAITDSFYRVANVGSGYVSHSFNQFIHVDNDRIVAVDHGDAYPRSAVLVKYRKNVSSGTFDEGWNFCSSSSLLGFAGATGANTTNASIGGFEVSSSHYLIAGNSTPQDNTSQRTRNIFVAVASKDNIQDTHVTWLTSQAEDGTNYLTTPHLVDLGNDTFMALWSDIGYDYNTFGNVPNVYYAIVDRQGNRMTKVMEGKGALSDCQPIATDGKVVWQVQENAYVTFYEIDLGTYALAKKQGKTKDWVDVESIAIIPSHIEAMKGYVFDAEIQVLPENATDKRILSTCVEGEGFRAYGNSYLAQELGEYTLRVDSPSGKYAECKVSIYPQIESWEYTRPAYELYVGETSQLTVKVKPDELQEHVHYGSTDPSILTITDAGLITAKKPGIASVYAEVASAKREFQIEVLPVIQENIALNVKEMELEIGKTGRLVVTITPDNATYKDYTFTSSNPEIASVDGYGWVTACAEGTATIAAVSHHGKTATSVVTVKKKDPGACRVFGFCSYNGKQYWYEDGKRQAVPGDPKNIWDTVYNLERGREIYDPESDGWYWLDTVYDGAKAVGKEVWVPYIYQEEDKWTNKEKRTLAYESDGGMGEYVYQCMREKSGKWVRYDGNGKMLKGWVTIQGGLAQIYPGQKGNTYYYDHRTGLMAKGHMTIDGTEHFFDEITGVLQY